uniref:PDZ domain-containing protein n=1 Tax=Neogobius melanostomus TaxID=47308 RepID=A0A8C6V1N2_9GOBI
MTPVLVNGSPKLPHLPMPNAIDHESFDITLHRRDSEGFGFVILTSKIKIKCNNMKGSPTDRCGLLHVGDRISINGEPARGISHTRAIELIQSGGSKVVLLLRPRAGLAQDSSEYSKQGVLLLYVCIAFICYNFGYYGS